MNILTGQYSGRSCWLALMADAMGVMMSLHVVTVQAQPAAGVSEPVSAVWQAYELDFHYAGFTTHYSCSGLENRLEQMLRDMGADKDVRVTATGCFGSADIGTMLSAHIHVRMPMTSGETQPQSFLVTSKPITLRSGGYGDTGAGDCELLEQVRDQILPPLKLQLVKDDLVCVPGQANHPGRALQVIALMPEPAPK